MLGEDAVIKAIFQPQLASAQVSSSAGAANQTLADSSAAGLSLVFSYDETQGSLDKGKNVSVGVGVPLAVTATPREGFYFEQWLVVSGSAVISGRYSPSVTITLTGGNAVVSAVFREKPIGTLDIQFRDYEGRTRTVYSRYQ
jgi:hypothetical protein